MFSSGKAFALMLATVLSRAQLALNAPQIRIDVHVGPGLPAFTLVGLPDSAVKESRDRIRAALCTCGFDYPAGRVTVSLSPADLPKEGARFDLPIAIALLIASDQLPGAPIIDSELYGELSLAGEVRPIRGLLPAVCVATQERRSLIIPRENLHEAQLVPGARVVPVTHLSQVAHHLRGTEPLHFAATQAPTLTPRNIYPDLADVRGQTQARRAVEIAAAGDHSLLLVGSPGTGKSMFDQRLPGLLPPLSEPQALEVAALASIGLQSFQPSHWRSRPFRAPHHSCSPAALIGGGSNPQPGEISLAHHGVLFLDEFPEFDRQALEALREPLETHRIVLSRASHRAEYPAQFQLVAAMNPCPCGYLHESGRCRCSSAQIQRYQSRISSPLLDRLDLHVRTHSIDPAQLRRSDVHPETTATVAARVAAARDIQIQRQSVCNAHLDVSAIEHFCTPTPDAQQILEHAINRFRLSARAYHRILKVARTLADLEGVDQIAASHLSEALLFRPLDPSTGHHAPALRRSASVTPLKQPTLRK